MDSNGVVVLMKIGFVGDLKCGDLEVFGCINVFGELGIWRWERFIFWFFLGEFGKLIIFVFFMLLILEFRENEFLWFIMIFGVM